MQQQTQIRLVTHAALVCLNGDIDATLTTSYEAALDVLRQRALHWGWELDPQHPLDREHATLEQLSELYAYNDARDTHWVAIASLLDPHRIVAPPGSNTQQENDEWAWEEDESDLLGDQGVWMEEHLDVLRSMSGRRYFSRRSGTILRTYAGLLLLAWFLLWVIGTLIPTFPGIDWGISLLGQWSLIVAVICLTDETDGPITDLESDEWDREEEPCDE